MVSPMSDVETESLALAPAAVAGSPLSRASRGVKPLRLPVWRCPRCGARKRLRGTRRGAPEAE